MLRTKPRVGISLCLLGERVRYDGRDSAARKILALIGPHVQWLPVCPEIEVGMGVPREPVHLVRFGQDIRLVTKETGRDWTVIMTRYARRRVAALLEMGISGYIFKDRSPSCGLKSTPVLSPGKRKPRKGPGIFARALMQQSPDLPVRESSGLTTARQCRRFLYRINIFGYPGTRLT